MIILSFYSHTLDGGDFVSLLYKEVDDFEAYAYHQKQFKKITKKDLLGKWTLFFFYPADFTFVCPTELEDLQEKYQEFKKVNCEIYVISTDTHFAHKTWHDISENISKIEYPMIGDPTHSLTYDFDVFDENDGLAQRGSFIIDPEGKIVVAGSSSVSPVMEKLKEAYLAVNTNADIEIQTSDSTTGVTSTQEGICDIGMASRDLKDTETGVTATTIAQDGIAVIVNNENPVENLTSDQVKSIFTGETTVWADVQ